MSVAPFSARSNVLKSKSLVNGGVPRDIGTTERIFSSQDSLSDKINEHWATI